MYPLSIQTQAVDEKKVTDFNKSLATWKTTIEHHLEGLAKYTSKMQQFLED